MDKIINFLNYNVKFSQDVNISVKHILVLIVTLWIAKIVISIFEKIAVKRLDEEDEKNKFDTIFSFGRWFLYILIFLISLDSFGVHVTTIFASFAALLVGVGMALQTWFQDIMAGIFIILDKSLQVGDIIEIDGKTGRVQDIRLRTTRAVTMDNKVLVIPNHLYLTSTLYNWTQNGSITRESVSVGVAYGSDLELVKKLLIQAVSEHPKVLKNPKPMVFFDDFGDSSLNFRIAFTMKDSFTASIPKSDIRFEIDRLFREHNISIPFPQRDVHIIKENYE